MRILNAESKELADSEWQGLGRLTADKVVKAHHAAQAAVEAVAEQWHYEIIAQYPNGGKDVRKVVDVPGVEAQEATDAWDEYEDILRFTPYTEEELAAIQEKAKDTVEARLEAIEKIMDKIEKILKVPLAALTSEEEK